MAFRALMILTMILQSVCFAADPLPAGLAGRSHDHLVDALAMDLAVLSDPEARKNIEVTSEENGNKKISIKDETGKVIHVLTVEYGKGKYEGLPIRFFENRSELKLNADWDQAKAQLKTMRSLYQSLREDSHPSFEEHIKGTMLLEEVLNPIRVKLANFLDQIIKAPLMREARQGGVNFRQREDDLEREADAKAAKVGWGALAVGIGLIGYGAYDLFALMNAPYYQAMNHSNLPQYGMAFGGALAVAWFVDMIPFLAGDNLTWMGRKFHERALQRMWRQEDAVASREAAEHQQLIERLKRRGPVDFQFGKIRVRQFMGSMTEVAADAWLIPERILEASRLSVGRAVIEAGGEAGLKAYEDLIKQNGKPFEFGTVHLTAGGEKTLAKKFLHAVTAGVRFTRPDPASSRRVDFSIVKKVYLEAFRIAGENGIRTIATPLLATGAGGSLTTAISQQAMLEAIQEYNDSNPSHELEVTVSIFDSGYQFEALERRLTEIQKNGIAKMRRYVATPNELCETQMYVQ